MRFSFSFPAALILSVPGAVIAQAPPVVNCTGLIGCGSGPSNVLLTSTLPTVIRLLGTFAGGAAVIFISVAGVQMVLSAGDESKVSSARWSVIYALGGLALAIMSQTIVAAVATETYGSAGGDFMVSLMRDVIRIILIGFNVTFGLAIMIAGIRMALGGGKADEFQKALFTIKWAIAGAVVTNSAGALVNALFNLGF
ncbi:hypothetical protein HYZ99_03880 [Candidatus Peregrinibacteria bacterium]|nr:hypothetical protein [Candidatus Peregrinibacteria bacterium]